MPALEFGVWPSVIGLPADASTRFGIDKGCRGGAGKRTAPVCPRLCGRAVHLRAEDLLPETTRAAHVDVATLGFTAGFTRMKALDHAA